MPLSNRLWTLTLAALALVALTASPPVPAQTEGTNYRIVSPPQPTSNPGKIEVTEFFSYACPHCNEFYPVLHTWLAKQGKDVVFKRVPVGFERPAWVNMQRAFYALEASGDLDKLDGALFTAIHTQRRQLFDEQSLADWVGANGGNSDKFASAYTSFGVNSQTVQADEMAERYNIEAVPTIAVDGKYVALGDTFPEILANTDQLIAKARAEHAAAAKGAVPKKN
jgi:protein dithiol oxidoreductase (disulfide-forming)